jgi:uncharacterized protein YsxB (DUF464 family)
MIKIYIDKSKYIEKVEIKGHANFMEHGKDIVCASVSSILTTTINAILSFDSDAIEYKEEEGYTLIKVTQNDNTTQILLNNMISLFKELEKQYKKNIKITK